MLPGDLPPQDRTGLLPDPFSLGSISASGVRGVGEDFLTLQPANGPGLRSLMPASSVLHCGARHLGAGDTLSQGPLLSLFLLLALQHHPGNFQLVCQIWACFVSLRDDPHPFIQLPCQQGGNEHCFVPGIFWEAGVPEMSQPGALPSGCTGIWVADEETQAYNVFPQDGK